MLNYQGMLNNGEKRDDDHDRTTDCEKAVQKHAILILLKLVVLDELKEILN